MARASRLLAVTTMLGVVVAVYLIVVNRDLRAELANARATADTAAAATTAQVDAARAEGAESARAPKPRDATLPFLGGVPPALPEAPKESRLERRKRGMEAVAEFLGRKPGETDEEYRARMVPLIKMGLAAPRERSAETRREVEALAKVTPEQSAAIDQAFEKVYDDALQYANKAITDGQLSPYERNVAGWLEVAGGMGSILGEAEGTIGKILDPTQVKAIYDSGFEWGEYLGAHAPWEELTPPPPRP